jgi:putative nucleotidyltransferase with HDIG domain
MSRPLTPLGRAFVTGVIALGAGALAWSLAELVARPVRLDWLALLALTVFSSTFRIRVPDVSVTISVSEIFVFVCVLLFGPAPAAALIAIDGLIISLWRRHRRIVQILFNTAEPALSIFVAAQAFFWLSGLDPRHPGPIRVGEHLVPLVVFTSTYFTLNSGLNAIVVSLQLGQPLWAIWRQHFGWLLLNYFAATSVAVLLVHNSTEFDVTALGVVMPLLVIFYLTFKVSIQRVEDANRHLEQLNRLYLSTIETLAMAVDAKDQITHGHIRRVQAYAVGLAKALGITDAVQLRAIEAAALLHDMGKLAIPEHILNKPGQLTTVEFEQMKLHASIGADILSAIDFPYPVVPIVRHHHEQWDGRGYPAGLAGTDIPIGARILAVVDCFDALTSDRPYRRRLTDEEAIDVLMEGRGTKYDPLVVDTFARVYRDIAPPEAESGPRRETLAQIASSAHREVAGEVPASGAGQRSLPLFEPPDVPPAEAILARATEELAMGLLAATPATLAALWVYDPERGDLRAAHTAGEGGAALRGRRMAVGERLSGWVAANRRTICNSDAALDFGDEPPAAERPLQSCLSVPLLAGEALVGVFSLYAPTAHAFSDGDREQAERGARPLAHVVRGTLEIEQARQASGPGALAPVPPAPDTPADGTACTVCRHPLAVVWLQVRRAPGAEAERTEGDSEHGDLGVPDAVLARAATSVRQDLRAADTLYRDGASGFLAVLPHADSRRADGIAARIAETLATALAALDDAGLAPFVVLAGVASAPVDGLTLPAVMNRARERAAPVALGRPPSRAASREGPMQADLFDAGGAP